MTAADGLDRLRRLAPAPPVPLEAGDAGSWPAVETALGTALPADYKAFVAAYGTGMFDDFLYVLTPFAADDDGNLLRQAELAAAAYPAYPAYPEPGGLLPAGRTQNGDQIFWRTGGEPDRWPVVALASRWPEPEEHGQGLVAFLVRLMEGTLATDVFPAELGRGGHVFTAG